MEHLVRFKMNEKLFLRNPEDSVLGRNILHHGLLLINKLGFEEFTFRKLAEKIHTTEAGIYRYFENKHRLLVYILTWYWSYLEFKVVFEINNLKNPREKLCIIIRLLAEEPLKADDQDLLPESEAYHLAIWEGSKAYLTRNIAKDNKDRLFKPYKDLCARFSAIISEFAPKYPYPHSLASSMMELAHTQRFFQEHLPSLTDFPKSANSEQLIIFLENILFSTLSKKP